MKYPLQNPCSSVFIREIRGSYFGWPVKNSLRFLRPFAAIPIREHERELAVERRFDFRLSDCQFSTFQFFPWPVKLQPVFHRAAFVWMISIFSISAFVGMVSAFQNND